MILSLIHIPGQKSKKKWRPLDAAASDDSDKSQIRQRSGSDLRMNHEDGGIFWMQPL